MKIGKINSSFLICVLFFLFIIFGNKVYLKRALNNEQLNFIVWDTYGYYLYLPAFIIHQDPGMRGDWPEKLNEKYNTSSTFYQIRHFESGKRATIYHSGLSICFLPGFLTGHFIASTFGYEADGLSVPYQICMLLNGLLYSLIAVFILRRLLLSYFTNSITSLVLVVIFFGTNYYMNAGLSLGMTHNVLFLTNCLYLLCIDKWFQTKQVKYALLSGIILGINGIIRPTELSLILIPLLWNIGKLTSWKEQLLYFRTNKISVLFFLLSIVFFAVLQLSYWKYTTGTLTYNLHGISLIWYKPFLLDFLFSYKKGWLLYTPIMAIGLASYYYIYIYNRKIFWSFLAYTVVIIYALSSWECWWYAGSFGQRPMVESYPFFAIGFGYLFIGISNTGLWKKRFVYSLLALIILLNMFQTWQYIICVIHPERMTEQYYWRIFGKLEVTEEENKYLSEDRSSVNEVFNEDIAKYTSRVLYEDSYEGKKDGDTTMLSTENPHTGLKSAGLDSLKKFSPGFEFKYYDITDKDYIWIRASVWVYATDSVVSPATNSAFVIYTINNGRMTKYKAEPLMNFNIKPKTWTQIHVDYMTPHITDNDSKIIINYWNIGNQKLFIDDMRIEILEPLDLK
ncbi:MAG: hypothetical protein H7259_04915 [Cytophagales bacterium]|nr:hypothetical protein [Cytophaga sp.]